MLLTNFLCCVPTLMVPPPTPALPPALEAPTLQRGVLVDRAEDGTLWVRGADYKLALSRAGASFRVRTGAARATEALELAPVRAFVGARELPLAPPSDPFVEPDGACFARGELLERWTFEPRGARQSFVLLAPPPAGDLVLRIAHSGALESVGSEHGLAFRGASGSEVRYGDWLAFDWRGRSATGSTAIAGASIEIRVPHAFLRAAAYPLCIDPLVSVATVVAETHEIMDPQIAVDDSLGVVTAVYTDEFAKGDLDIVARRMTEAGTFLSDIAVEISDEYTLNPAIANHESANQFLIAWEDLGDEPYELSRIRARTVAGATGSLGSVWSVHAGDACGFPAVGGSSSASTGANYYVTWNEFGLVPFLDRDIAGRTVSPSGSMGSRSLLDGRSSEQSRPRISKRSGNGNRWMVVYTTELENTVTSVDCAFINTSGTVLLDKHSLSHGVFSVPDVDGDGTEFLTVFESTTASGTSDLIGMRSTFTSGTPTTVGYALSVFELSSAQLARDQRQPVVARTKGGFAYAYSEAEGTNFPADSVFAASILQNASPLTFTEKRVLLGHGGGVTIANGLLDKRCCVLWQSLGGGSQLFEMAIYDAP